MSKHFVLIDGVPHKLPICPICNNPYKPDDYDMEYKEA